MAFFDETVDAVLEAGGASPRGRGVSAAILMEAMELRVRALNSQHTESPRMRRSLSVR